MGIRVPVRNGVTGTLYLHFNGDDKMIAEKVYDPNPALDHAMFMRNEVKQTGQLRKVMSIPAAKFHELMQQGKLGEESYVNGSCVVDEKALANLMRDPDLAGLRCVDKL
jgi:hypothetical protein